MLRSLLSFKHKAVIRKASELHIMTMSNSEIQSLISTPKTCLTALQNLSLKGFAFYLLRLIAKIILFCLCSLAICFNSKFMDRYGFFLSSISIYSRVYAPQTHVKSQLQGNLPSWHAVKLASRIAWLDSGWRWRHRRVAGRHGSCGQHRCRLSLCVRPHLTPHSPSFLARPPPLLAGSQTLAPFYAHSTTLQIHSLLIVARPATLLRINRRD